MNRAPGAASIAVTAGVDSCSSTSRAIEGRMPSVAYVSRNTCIARTPMQSASASVAMRRLNSWLGNDGMLCAPNVQSSSEKRSNLAYESTLLGNGPPNQGGAPMLYGHRVVIGCARKVKCLFFQVAKPRTMPPCPAYPDISHRVFLSTTVCIIPIHPQGICNALFRYRLRSQQGRAEERGRSGEQGDREPLRFQGFGCARRAGGAGADDLRRRRFQAEAGDGRSAHQVREARGGRKDVRHEDR